VPTFYIEQFGCRATQADGAALERQLLNRGYSHGTKDSAEIVVLNTCTVTAAADAQARDAIRKISAQNRNARMIVTGCYAQRAPEELAQLPGVAWVVGNSHKPELPAIIDGLSRSNSTDWDAASPLGFEFRVSSVPSSSNNFVPADTLHSVAGPKNTAPASAKILTGDFAKAPLLSAPVFGGEAHHTRPTLKIQDGCNARCSYCVIPFVRGKSRSLPPEIVLDEIHRLTNAGTKEIVLSGINLGTYGNDLHPRVNFEDLLKRILDDTPVERLRVSSVEPLDVTADLINFFAHNERMAQHFHMPLQSGCDRILAAMHRWYRAEHYARRVELIRDVLPHAAIGADVIAGFPGETAAEHAQTIAFIEKLPFSYLHVFSFSSRPDTAAEKLADHVAPQEVKRRARELRALGEKKSAAFRDSQVGRQLRVLTLRTDSAAEGSEDYSPALSSNYSRVHIPGNWSPNQWLDVRVNGVGENFLVAKAEASPAFPLNTLAAAACR
jgi:threonylcarbamoyladenosine tRNA methylthiotransferase MtaB